VTLVDDTLMLGHVSRLAGRQDVPDLDLASWLTMLRRARDAFDARGGNPGGQAE